MGHLTQNQFMKLRNVPHKLTKICNENISLSFLQDLNVLKLKHISYILNFDFDTSVGGKKMVLVSTKSKLCRGMKTILLFKLKDNQKSHLKTTTQRLTNMYQKSSWKLSGFFSQKMRMHCTMMMMLKNRRMWETMTFLRIRWTKQNVSGNGR